MTLYDLLEDFHRTIVEILPKPLVALLYTFLLTAPVFVLVVVAVAIARMLIDNKTTGAIVFVALICTGIATAIYRKL